MCTRKRSKSPSRAPKNAKAPSNSKSSTSSMPESDKLNPAYEFLTLMSGILILVPFGPFVAWQVFWCTVWEFVDKKSLNLIQLCAKASDVVGPKLKGLVRHPKDGFVIILLVYLGVFMPALFFYELNLSLTAGFNYKRCLAFNLFRIGPMYANFMWVYVMCHKEGHAINGSLLKRGIMDKLFGSMFNHWVGMFHGVIPGVFTISHIHNHHKYDNDENDVYSTAYRPRDEFTSWVRYVPEWMAYATNASSLVFFIQQKEWKRVVGTMLSTMYYCAFVGLIWHFSPMFCFWYLVYPLIEGNILLSVVNYTWHAFIDPEDPSNDYVNSTTVYAGVHWSKHRALYEKHLPEYKKAKASIFYGENLFVIFGCIVAKDYTKLAELYYEPGNMTKTELADMMKARLRCAGRSVAKMVGRSAKSVASSKKFMSKEIKSN
ncbi:hypothetical protein TrST_g13281 [Triparma strigata]|uniref:Fatty acid desaturase domain-containing protein n=1 Tax=Triparma strigata TaxID=1606541 RepID=A0A9W7BIU3_9STRA|nr:hypothetical protein TrST_g13281 [Triparma strigata]